jgi:hypothetical protein
MLSSWVVTINIPYYRKSASNTAHNILEGLSGFKGVYIVTVVGHPAFSLMTHHRNTHINHVSIRSFVGGLSWIAHKAPLL